MPDSSAFWHLYTRTRTGTRTRTRTGTSTHTYDVRREHDLQHGHEAWTWTCNGHGDGQASWMPECQNADKKFSPASAFWHRGQSGTVSHGLVR
jgi:hypothetical protein